MDGLKQVIQVPGDLNPDPTGQGSPGPKGGLHQYQDDFDTKKHDVATEDIGDDPSTRLQIPRSEFRADLARTTEDTASGSIESRATLGMS